MTNIEDLRRIVEESATSGSPRRFSRYYARPSSSRVNEKTAYEKAADLENDKTVQDMRLKYWSAIVIFLLLSVETYVIFNIVYLQGYGYHNGLFHIEEWGFRTLCVATITQVSYMVHTIVQHLFPVKKK